MRPRLPHVRGGVSASVPGGTACAVSSPRAWGCFQDHQQVKRRHHVFPTCVGVFLTACTMGNPRHSLPHVRGGVSTKAAGAPTLLPSSPRAWGCFLSSSAGAGIRGGLPHVRGGVSKKAYIIFNKTKSSPRAWGCFLQHVWEGEVVEVFPTCVGVFLSIQ